MYTLLALDTMSKETKENFFSAKVGPIENKSIELREMLNMVIVQQRNISFNDDRLQRTKKLANELINDLEKEYNIE
jgi:hypothetical protein